MKGKGSEGMLNSLGAYCIGIFWKPHFITCSERRPCG